MTVAALYVDPDGVYANLPDVEVWDEQRDARLYAGPWPVVAHPPCNRWVSYGALSKRGDDDGCFAAALDAVQTYGGVLEHPAQSQAWAAYGLPQPRHGRGEWVGSLLSGGWATEVDQWLYGFPTRKVTWLFFVGDVCPSLLRGRVDATRGCDALWSTQRSKTPPAFRDVLLAMARSAAKVAA